MTADRGEPLTAGRNAQPAWVKACLAAFFFLAEHAPWVLRLIRPLVAPITVWLSRSVAGSLRFNAARIFGKSLDDREQKSFARGVVRNFFDFVAELARSGKESIDTLRGRIESVEGEPAYLNARKRKRGVIFVTAHMGAFEVGLAALRRVEPRVHVVFKRDEFPGFERLRRRTREKLDIREAAIDDGLPALMSLRDALLANEAVVMQGDRAMPGQRSQIVPFLYGRLRMPVGPVKLALLTGSPIVPVFVLRADRGKFRIHLGEPIEVEAAGGIDAAMPSLAKTFASFVGRDPEQWLVLERAFVGDLDEESCSAA